MAESLADILIAITEIQGKLFESQAEIKKCQDELRKEFLNIFIRTCEETIKDLVIDAEKVGHFCSVCYVVLINNEKTKINCICCVEDFKNCRNETIMNFGQFAERQLERIEIFKKHRPQEIQLMQKKENES